MPDEPDAIEALMRALQRRAEDEGDKNTRTLFTEVRDELRKLNDNLAGTHADDDLVAEHEDLSRRYPALKTKPPRPRRRAS
jgi:hypothetical protein